MLTHIQDASDELGPTITTKIAISNGRFGHYDINQNRSITVREAAALQTFPDHFVIEPEESFEKTSRLVGNAVPPRFARYISDFIKSKIT